MSIIVNPLHHYYRPPHLEHVISEMRRLGPPRIRAYLDGEVWACARRHAPIASMQGAWNCTRDGTCRMAEESCSIGTGSDSRFAERTRFRKG